MHCVKKVPFFIPQNVSVILYFKNMCSRRFSLEPNKWIIKTLIHDCELPEPLALYNIHSRIAAEFYYSFNMLYLFTLECCVALVYNATNCLGIWLLKLKAICLSSRTALRLPPTDEQLPQLWLWMFWTEMTWAPCSCLVFWWTTPVTATLSPIVPLFLN